MSAIVLLPILFVIAGFIGWGLVKLERIARAIEEIARRMAARDEARERRQEIERRIPLE
jgi:hypothetical protein